MERAGSGAAYADSGCVAVVHCIRLYQIMLIRRDSLAVDANRQRFIRGAGRWILAVDTRPERTLGDTCVGTTISNGDILRGPRSRVS